MPRVIRTRKPSKRAAADPRLRLGSQLDRPELNIRERISTEMKHAVQIDKNLYVDIY
jgi:hypothetical protein